MFLRVAIRLACVQPHALVRVLRHPFDTLVVRSHWAAISQYVYVRAPSANCGFGEYLFSSRNESFTDCRSHSLAVPVYLLVAVVDLDSPNCGVISAEYAKTPLQRTYHTQFVEMIAKPGTRALAQFDVLRKVPTGGSPRVFDGALVDETRPPFGTDTLALTWAKCNTLNRSKAKLKTIRWGGEWGELPFLAVEFITLTCPGVEELEFRGMHNVFGSSQEDVAPWVKNGRHTTMIEALIRSGPGLSSLKRLTIRPAGDWFSSEGDISRVCSAFPKLNTISTEPRTPKEFGFAGTEQGPDTLWIGTSVYVCACYTCECDPITSVYVR